LNGASLLNQMFQFSRRQIWANPRRQNLDHQDENRLQIEKKNASPPSCKKIVLSPKNNGGAEASEKPDSQSIDFHRLSGLGCKNSWA
jgi:hypothetical protein